MIDLVRAAEIARQHLETLGSTEPLELVNAQLRQNGWLFHFQSRLFLATGDLVDLLGGNYPFLVDNSGSVVQFGSSEDIETVAGRPLFSTP